MRTLAISYAGCALLGLVPYGEAEPAVYGLIPKHRQHGAWVFEVGEFWRLEVVRAVVHRLAPETVTPSVATTLVGRLNVALAR